MIFEIYCKDPEQLLKQILKSVDENTARHMEHWEIVNVKGVDYLTQRDVKYYFKVLLLPEVLDLRKIRFTFLFHEYSDPAHFVQCEYVGQFTECVMYNFGDIIIGLQIYP